MAERGCPQPEPAKKSSEGRVAFVASCRCQALIVDLSTDAGDP
jgi:hypothetical protein